MATVSVGAPNFTMPTHTTQTEQRTGSRTGRPMMRESDATWPCWVAFRRPAELPEG